MGSTTETGHAKNVANLQELISSVNAFGSTYNPSKEALSQAKLIELKATADIAINDVLVKYTVYNNTVNERAMAYNGLKTLSTRLVNALQATDASTLTIKDAIGFNRKIQGARAAKIKKPEDPNKPAPLTISSSQQSFDQLEQHFAGLISVLKSEPYYAPNEEDLKITSLNDRLANMKAKNNDVKTAYTDVSNSRIVRNNVLYAKNTGLVDIALEVKKYVTSVFGARSPEFKQVNRIKFENRKI